MGQGNAKKSLIDAKMKAKEWQWELDNEMKSLSKEIKKIEGEEAKLKKEIEVQAAKGNVSAVQTLAKNIVKSRSAVKRLEKTKASMYSVKLSIGTSIATMSTTGALKVSADTMARMNKIAKVDSVGKTMEDMKREMTKIAEAEEFMEDALRDSDEEEETAVEVQKVLEAMALDSMGPLAQSTAPSAVAAQPEVAPAAPVAVPKQAILEGAEAPPAKPKFVPSQQAAADASKAASAAAAAPTPAASSQEDEIAKLKAQLAALESANASAASSSAAPAVAPAPAAAAPAPAIAPSSQAAPPSAPTGGGSEDDLLARLAALKS